MLRACSSCSCHYRVEDVACPHCRALPSPLRRPAAAILLGLALGGCVDKDSVALYGMPYDSSMDADADGDGWAAADDCDDDNPDVHPEATETAGDGIDSNCDGEDDT